MKKISQSLLTVLALVLSLPSYASDADAVTTERRSDQRITLKNNKAATVTTQSYRSHVWFHSIDVYLSGDRNSNGYYHRLEVDLDADTSANYLPVFAEFSLLPSYGNERIFYTSSIFGLYRQSADDWLGIDTILENNFALDKYLLTVRLYDANTGYLVAELSGFDEPQLDLLALEDVNRDSYIQGSTTVEVSAGTTGIFALLALCLALGSRRYRMPRS